MLLWVGSAGLCSFLGKFKAAFKEADATFQMSGNDLELSVLAGSALCWIFSQEADEADEASLARLLAGRKHRESTGVARSRLFRMPPLTSMGGFENYENPLLVVQPR